MKKITTLFITSIITVLFNGCIMCHKDNVISDDSERRKEAKKAFISPENNPNLPNILIIGDSISIGYTHFTRIELEGVANVYRIPENGRNSYYVNYNLQKWLGDKDWDIIHFNYGIWDLVNRDPNGYTNGGITTSQEEYKEQLEKTVRILMKTNAILIWASTTPIPTIVEGRTNGVVAEYNDIAKEIMDKYGIRINDLYQYTLDNAKKMRQYDSIHFLRTGYKYLSREVAKEIMNALTSKQ